MRKPLRYTMPYLFILPVLLFSSPIIWLMESDEIKLTDIINNIFDHVKEISKEGLS